MWFDEDLIESLFWRVKYFQIRFRRAMFFLGVLAVLSIWFLQLRYLAIMTPRCFSELTFSSIVFLKFTLISDNCNLVSLWCVVTSMILFFSIDSYSVFWHQIYTFFKSILSLLSSCSSIVFPVTWHDWLNHQHTCQVRSQYIEVNHS